MGNEAAYSCVALFFLVFVVLFAVSMRTSSRTRRYCQSIQSTSTYTTYNLCITKSASVSISKCSGTECNCTLDSPVYNFSASTLKLFLHGVAVNIKKFITDYLASIINETLKTEKNTSDDPKYNKKLSNFIKEVKLHLLKVNDIDDMDDMVKKIKNLRKNLNDMKQDSNNEDFKDTLGLLINLLDNILGDLSNVF